VHCISKGISNSVPGPQENYGLRSMMIPTIAVIGDILSNSYIIWFLLIDFPSRCTRLAAETGGDRPAGWRL